MACKFERSWLVTSFPKKWGYILKRLWWIKTVELPVSYCRSSKAVKLSFSHSRSSIYGDSKRPNTTECNYNLFWISQSLKKASSAEIKTFVRNNSLVFSCATSLNVSKELLPRNVLISLERAFWSLLEFQNKYQMNFIVFSPLES